MKTKRIILSLLALGMLLGLVGCSSAKDNEPVVDNTVEQETDEQQQARFEERYQEAIALESSKPDAAIRMFESLNDYKDSKERVSDYKFNEGMELFDKGSYSIGLVKNSSIRKNIQKTVTLFLTSMKQLVMMHGKKVKLNML